MNVHSHGSSHRGISMVIWIDTLYADTVAESVADVHHYVPAVHLQKEEIVL